MKHLLTAIILAMFFCLKVELQVPVLWIVSEKENLTHSPWVPFMEGNLSKCVKTLKKFIFTLLDPVILFLET